MKTNAMPFMGNNLTTAVLGVLALVIVFAALTGRRLPLVSSDRAALIALVVVGMAMCARGIGRVAAAGLWAHPVAIVGYLLGAVILALAVAVLVGKPFPWVTTVRQAIVAVAGLGVAKLILSTLTAGLFK